MNIIETFIIITALIMMLGLGIAMIGTALLLPRLLLNKYKALIMEKPAKHGSDIE